MGGNFACEGRRYDHRIDGDRRVMLKKAFLFVQIAIPILYYGTIARLFIRRWNYFIFNR